MKVSLRRRHNVVIFPPPLLLVFLIWLSFLDFIRALVHLREFIVVFFFSLSYRAVS